MRKFLAGLAAAALASAVTLYVANSTLFKAEFIKTKTAQANVYPDLASGFHDAVKGDPGKPVDPQQQALQALITPQFVQTEFETFADQLEPFLRGTGPRPSLTLAQLKTEAVKQGIPVPPEADQTLSKDLLPANAFGQPAGQVATNPPLRDATRAMMLAFLAAVILAALAIVVDHRHWLKTLARVWLLTAFWLAVSWAIFRFAPGVISSLLNKPGSPQALIDALRRWADVVVGGFAQNLLIAAGGFAAASLVTEVIHFVLVGHGKHEAKAKSAKSKTTAVKTTKQL